MLCHPLISNLPETTKKQLIIIRNIIRSLPAWHGSVTLNYVFTADNTTGKIRRCQKNVLQPLWALRFSLLKGTYFENWLFPQICCDFPKTMFCNVFKLLHSNCCYYYGWQMKFWPFICWGGLVSTRSFGKESQFWAPWNIPSSRYHRLKQTGRLRTEL